MSISNLSPKLVSPLSLGGAPFENEDFTNLQHNAKMQGLSLVEYLSARTLKMEHFELGVLDESCESGVMVVPPTIDISDINNAVVSPFLFFSENELIYNGGGVFDLSLGKTLFFTKGVETVNQRVYADGLSKDFDSTIASQSYIGTYDVTDKYTFNPSMDLSKQHVSIRVQGSTPIFDQEAKKALGVDANTTLIESVDQDLQDAKAEIEKSTNWTALNIESANITQVTPLQIKRNKIGTVFLRGRFDLTGGGNDLELALSIPVQFGAYDMMLPSKGTSKDLNNDFGTSETDGHIFISGQDISVTRKSGDTMHFYLDGIVLEPSFDD